MKRSILKDKSKVFAIRIIRMCEYIQEKKREYIMTKQVLRSGTSIGANICEAFFAQSIPDFIAKLHISRRECGETQYWLELLHETEKISDTEFESINSDCDEMGKLLTTSVKSAISKLPENKKKQYLVEEPIETYGTYTSDDLEDFLNTLLLTSYDL